MTTSRICVQKSSMRARFREILSGMKPSVRKIKSRKISALLLKSELFKKAKTVFVFISLPGEVQTRPLIEAMLRAGKKVFAPKMKMGRLPHFEVREVLNMRTGLRKGKYGVLEPSRGKKISARQLDLILVPGLAFDKKGNRLGRGKGYFDRFLEKTEGIPKVGLAFKEQLARKVPSETHDIAVDRLIIG